VDGTIIASISLTISVRLAYFVKWPSIFLPARTQDRHHRAFSLKKLAQKRDLKNLPLF
jgi:hypothetical protein